jgi:hypothetical protein
MMLFMLPLTLFSRDVGFIILDFCTLLAIVLSIRAIHRENPIPFYLVLLALLNWQMFSLLFLGQTDAFAFVGIVMGWLAVRHRKPLWLSLAFWLLLIKPLNILLVGLLYLMSIRNWSWREIALAVSIPILSLPITALFIGEDWIIRFIENPGEAPPDSTQVIQTSWVAAEHLHVPPIIIGILAVIAIAAFLWAAWRYGTSEWTVSLALSTNFLFSPHLNQHNYILLVPAFIYVGRHHPRLAWLVYLSTWGPFIRAIFGNDFFPVDIFYALILLISAWVLGWQERDVIRPEA